jgi:hypothetical protein
MMGGSKGKEGYKGEGELIQSILYTSMELKWNPFVWSTYAN